MSRACRRPGCDRSAVARLSYDAVTCQVWLDVLPERPGSVQEICELHVDRLTVPRGWMLCDRRVEEPAMFVTEPDATPPRARRPRPPSSEPDPVLMVEPGLFDPATAPAAEADAPDDGPRGEAQVEEVEVEVEVELLVVEELVVEELVVDEGTTTDEARPDEPLSDEPLSDEPLPDDPLLRPNSPLLARAFRAAGTSPAVLAPPPDAVSPDAVSPDAGSERRPGDGAGE